MNNTVARVFAIMDLLANAAGPLTMADIRKELDLPKSSTSDLVNSLIELDILECNQDDANSLEPGINFFELAAKFVNKNRLLPVARNTMAALVRDTGQSAFLMMFDGRNLMFLEKVDAPGRLQSHYSPGETVPLHASAAGKAVLATRDNHALRALLGHEPFAQFSQNTLVEYKTLLDDLTLSRTRKYTLENKERDNSLVSVGAPIRQYDGSTVAAVTLTNLNNELSPERVQEVGPLVYAAALRISRFLGYAGKDIFQPSTQ